MSKLKESFILNVAFPLADKLMGTCAMKWYKQIVQMNTWTAEKVNAWQLEHLNKLVHHVYEHTKYYREVFDDLGLKPDDIQCFDDLKQLPVLTRDIVKERYDDLIPDNIKRFKHRMGKTGGSTGEPMKYIFDENTWGFVTAMKIYSWKQTGYRYGDLFVSLGSSSLFPVNKKSLIHEIYFKLRNTIPLNGMNMDDEHCRKYMEIIQKKQVHYIYGYATAVYLLAKYCKDNGVQWQMKAAFTTAEKLTETYRTVIAETWNAQVMDCYGSKDGGVTAYEVEKGIYHVGYMSYFETTENGGQPSKLYATNLLDYAFPTIRYFNGDEVIMCGGDARTGYNGQCMKMVVGRTSDVVEFGNGHKLTTSGFNSLFRGFNVEAFRIRKQGNMEVLVQIQKRESYTDEEETLLYDTIKKYVGDDCSVTFEYVNHFEPLPNGKRSFMLNS